MKGEMKTQFCLCEPYEGGSESSDKLLDFLPSDGQQVVLDNGKEEAFLQVRTIKEGITRRIRALAL